MLSLGFNSAAAMAVCRPAALSPTKRRSCAETSMLTPRRLGWNVAAFREDPNRGHSAPKRPARQAFRKGFCALFCALLTFPGKVECVPTTFQQFSGSCIPGNEHSMIAQLCDSLLAFVLGENTSVRLIAASSLGRESCSCTPNFLCWDQL